MSYYLLTHTGASDEIMLTIAAALVIFLGYRAFQYPAYQRNRLIALTLLIGLSVIFWALYWQIFLSINLMVNRVVDRQIFGTVIPANTFVFFEAFFIFILGVPFAKLWRTLHRGRFHTSAFTKFALSLIATAIAFQLLVILIHHTDASHQIAPGWMIPFYFFITVGELLISPIGLAAVTRLAPKDMTGLMMGAWFMALGFGGFLGGHFANAANIPLGLVSMPAIHIIYAKACAHYAMIGWVSGFLLLLASPFLGKLSQPQADQP